MERRGSVAHTPARVGVLFMMGRISVACLRFVCVSIGGMCAEVVMAAAVSMVVYQR